MTFSTARDRFHFLSFAFALVVSLVVAACGGGGSGGGGGTNGFSNLDLLVTDAPADDLAAFRATVAEVHFVIQGGGETANLLAGPVTLEMLGLQSQFAWLASQDLPADTYTGVRLVFTPASYDARLNDGAAVAVVSTSDEMTLDFATPLVVTDNGYKKVVLDVDLASSLTGSVATPPITFAPQGSVSTVSASTSTSIDEIKGTVDTVDGGAGTFVLDAFADDDSIVTLGQVLVRVTGATLLIQDDGAEFATSAAFFAALVPSATHLEVHGALVNGAVTATRIEVEDNAAGGGEDNLVKIEGLVIGVGPGDALSITILDVEKGEAIVAAASGGSVPDTLDVVWDNSTVFFLEEHQLTTEDSLAVGQKVKVKFASFTNPPYTASRIEIEDEAVENEGTITSIDALPTSFVAHLRSDSPAILSGQVLSTATDVTVTLNGITPTLDTESKPSIAIAELLAGLKFEVHGALSGVPATPAIDATKLVVKAGELDNATVVTVDTGNAQFTTSGGEIDDPFGTGVTAGPQTVLIASNCVFEGDAETRAAFYALFAGLSKGESLEVRVEGIGTGDVNEIKAYQVRARLKD
ncbi:MAG: DUF4382 domain-containing protein [Planctomycetota bacterium]